MTRHQRRLAWHLTKSEFRGVGARTHWRDMWRASWSSHTLGSEGHGSRISHLLPYLPNAREARRRKAVARHRKHVTGNGDLEEEVSP